jgi:hypothetical protein
MTVTTVLFVGSYNIAPWLTMKRTFFCSSQRRR